MRGVLKRIRAVEYSVIIKVVVLMCGLTVVIVITASGVVSSFAVGAARVGKHSKAEHGQR